MPVALDDMLAGLSAEDRAEVERGAIDLVVENRTLSELRRSLKVTQRQLADALSSSQAHVAKTERREDVMVSTVARVVEALGGRLRLLVDLPGRPVIQLSLGRRPKGGLDDPREPVRARGLKRAS